MSKNALLPHHKLDWMIAKLEDALEQSVRLRRTSPGSRGLHHSTEEHSETMGGGSGGFSERLELTDFTDSTEITANIQLDPTNEQGVRMHLAKCHLSKGFFHSGGEQSCSAAYRQAQKVLQESPEDVDALAIMGLAMIGKDRADNSVRYFERALSAGADNALLQLGLGSYFRTQSDPRGVIHHLKICCTLAPETWEPQLLIGRTLLALGQQENSEGLLRQSLYHLVLAMQCAPHIERSNVLLRDIGIACLLNGYPHAAERLFSRLRQDRANQAVARYYMGLVAFDLKKYNNSVQHFRAFLQEKSDDPKALTVLSKLAAAYHALGDLTRARQTCQRALSLDRFHLPTRLVMGQIALDNNEMNEALRVFRETLNECPEDLDAYSEIVGIRARAGEHRWLGAALRAEVGQYGIMASNPEIQLVIRERIGVILDQMFSIGPELGTVILDAINHTQDETMRFALWETACTMSEQHSASQCFEELQAPGMNFSVELAAQVLTTGHLIPEPLLRSGLNITDVDLKRAAVDRYAPAHDVKQHRSNEEKERKLGRAYQALLLLAIADHRTPEGTELLKSWVQQADTEMGIAARIGLAMGGDIAATKYLEELAQASTRKKFLARIKRGVNQSSSLEGPNIYTGAQHTCSRCSRSGPQRHFFQLNPHQIVNSGKPKLICDVCTSELAIQLNRRFVEQEEKPASEELSPVLCTTCSQTVFTANALASDGKVSVCNNCIELSVARQQDALISEFFVDRGWESPHR